MPTAIGDDSYNEPAMAGRPATKEAPPFGRRLAALRKQRGLTQRELADRLGVRPEMVDYYERRAANPSLEVVQRAARALDVTAAELLDSEPPARQRAKRGPVSQLDARIAEVKKLPRKEQEFVLKFLDTVIERAKAS
jgi:transcriptional regulator with XRE-family HTH domain